MNLLDLARVQMALTERKVKRVAADAFILPVEKDLS